MKVEQTIAALESMARLHPEHSEDIGRALGVLRHYQKNGLSPRDRFTRLPDSSEAFGYFVVHECTENGDLIRIVSDDSGNPIEFLPGSLVVELGS